jgi:hypothetical protein
VYNSLQHQQLHQLLKRRTNHPLASIHRRFQITTSDLLFNQPKSTNIMYTTMLASILAFSAAATAAPLVERQAALSPWEVTGLAINTPSGRPGSWSVFRGSSRRFSETLNCSGFRESCICPFRFRTYANFFAVSKAPSLK